MKKRQQVDLAHTIPSNATDAWYNNSTTMYFFDRYHNVELYQHNEENGSVQHISLTPNAYINFTQRLKSAGFINGFRPVLRGQHA